MLVRALVSFVGSFSAHPGKVFECNNDVVLRDLLQAGYVEEVKTENSAESVKVEDSAEGAKTEDYTENTKKESSAEKATAKKDKAKKDKKEVKSGENK